MLQHQSFDPPQFNGAEASVAFPAHGVQPEFSLALLAAHVNVWGLRAVAGVEEKPVRPDSKNGGHVRGDECLSWATT